MAVSPYRVTPARIGRECLSAEEIKEEPEHQALLLLHALLLLFWIQAQQQRAVVEHLHLAGGTSELGVVPVKGCRQPQTGGVTDPGPVLYTEAMAADDDDLLSGVTVDATDELTRA